MDLKRMKIKEGIHKKLLCILVALTMVCSLVMMNNMSVHAGGATNWNRFNGDSTSITLDNDSLTKDAALEFINSKFSSSDKYDNCYVVYAKNNDAYSYLNIKYDAVNSIYTIYANSTFTLDNMTEYAEARYTIYVIGTVTSDHNSGKIEPQGFTITHYDDYYKISGVTVPEGKHLVVCALLNTVVEDYGGPNNTYNVLLSEFDVFLHNYDQANEDIGFGAESFECHDLGTDINQKIIFSQDANPDAGIYVGLTTDKVLRYGYDCYLAYTMGMTTNPIVGTSSVNQLQPELTPSVSKTTLTTSNFTFTAPVNLTAGEARSATVIAASGVTGMGDITVYYSTDNTNWSTTIPSTAGTYYVAIDVTEGDSYTAGTKIADSTWKFTLSTPSSSTPATTPVATTTATVSEWKIGETRVVNNATLKKLTDTTANWKNKNIYTTKISIPSTVVVDNKTYKITSLKRDCVHGHYVKKLVIPSTVTNLEYACFAGDKHLTSIKINSSNLTLAKNLFRNISKKQRRKTKVTISKNMSKKKFNAVRTELVKQGLKWSNIKRK